MNSRDFDQQLKRLAVLEEPVRRSLYAFVSGQDEPVGRDRAAKALDISRALAAFHLDKLVAAGLLETSYRRLSARTGPGAGRTAKLYRRSPEQLEVLIPPRRYELAAGLLAKALAGSGDGKERLQVAARERGRELAAEGGVRSARGRPISRAAHALRACGFEPRRSPEGELLLRNCPFDSLTVERRGLICGMNLALIEGLLLGLQLPEVHATLAPREGRCCVVLHEAAEDN